MSNQPAPRRMSDEEMEKADMLIQSGYLGLHGHPYRKSMMRLRHHITALEAERAVVAGEADEVAERLFELINNLHRGSGTMHDQLSNFISPILIERDRYQYALQQTVVHTGYLPGAEAKLLGGLLDSIQRIAKSALRNSPGGEGESK